MGPFSQVHRGQWRSGSRSGETGSLVGQGVPSSPIYHRPTGRGSGHGLALTLWLSIFQALK